MKKLLIFLVLVGFTQLGYSQSLIQTFTDRCTGETKVFSIAMEGSTTIVFYNKSRSFTAADVQSGVFQSWLEETYAWWLNLSPCSTNQSSTTNTQTTTQNTTSNATNAANNATSNTTNTSSSTSTNASNSSDTTSNTNTNTNDTSTGNNTSDSGSTDTGSSSDNSTSNTSSDNSNSTDNSSDSSSGDSGSGDSSGDGNDSSDNSSGDTEGDSGDKGGDSNDGDSGEGDQGDNSEEGSGDSDDTSDDSKDKESSEEDSKSESEESEDNESEESESDEVEEEKEEENKEEEKEEEESEEEEEEKEESTKEEEEEEEEEKKLAPPIITANLVTMQMLDGTISTAASFGVSQSSLTGVETYSLNGMVWSNLKQFMLGGGISTVYFRYDRKQPRMLVDPDTGKYYEFGHTMEKGSIWSIDSHNVNFMYMFGTTMVSYNYSQVYLGQKDNFWKGFVGGYAVTVGAINSFGKISSSNSITGFGSKPFNFKQLPRWTFTPMVAISAPVKIMPLDLQINPFNHFTFIVGNSTNFKISQRFVANLGINIVGNSDPLIPFTFAATIGSRFAF